MAGIVVEGLSKTYIGARAPALDRVSLTVAAGEVCGIIGPNGAGKTTLFGCLLGFLNPDSGSVSIDGKAPDDRSIRARTGYLPERLIMDRWMTGRDFLAYHHALARLPAAGRAREVDAGLEQVGLAGEAAGRRVSSYSRGMLQRLGVAQALLGHPDYLFLDEPTSGMDPNGVLLFRSLIQRQSERGCTVLLNSHQLDQVEKVCHRVIFVKGGQVAAMETVHAGAAGRRTLQLRLAAGTPPEVEDALVALSLPEGCRFDRRQPGGPAFYTVDSDAAAAALLRRLIEAGLPVVEAVPGEGRLERLFQPDAGGAR